MHEACFTCELAVADDGRGLLGLSEMRCQACTDPFGRAFAGLDISAGGCDELRLMVKAD